MPVHLAFFHFQRTDLCYLREEPSRLRRICAVYPYVLRVLEKWIFPLKKSCVTRYSSSKCFPTLCFIPARSFFVDDIAVFPFIPCSRSIGKSGWILQLYPRRVHIFLDSIIDFSMIDVIREHYLWSERNCCEMEKEWLGVQGDLSKRALQEVYTVDDRYSGRKLPLQKFMNTFSQTSFVRWARTLYNLKTSRLWIEIGFG